jgi:hypothetical protein
MIKPELLRYLNSAVEVLNSGSASEMAELKILRVISQFTDIEAKIIEEKFIKKIDNYLETNV